MFSCIKWDTLLVSDLINNSCSNYTVTSNIATWRTSCRVLSSDLVEVGRTTVYRLTGCNWLRIGGPELHQWPRLPLSCIEEWWVHVRDCAFLQTRRGCNPVPNRLLQFRCSIQTHTSPLTLSWMSLRLLCMWVSDSEHTPPAPLQCLSDCMIVWWWDCVAVIEVCAFQLALKSPWWVSNQQKSFNSALCLPAMGYQTVRNHQCS